MSKLAEIQPIEAVTERDIDLLIIEELFANVDFFNWIVSNTIKEPDLKFVKAFHSLSDETGETDIAVLCKNQRKKTLLLIENKIDANFQPKQAERYRLRGENHIFKNECNKFYTFLVAPKQYIVNNDDFDFYIEYELLKEYFKQWTIDINRSKFKIELLDLAIEKYRRGYSTNPDERAIDFHRKLYEYSNKYYPHLQKDKINPNAPIGSTTFCFTPEIVKNDKNTWLCFVASGKAVIWLGQMADKLDDVKEKYKSTLTEEMQIEKAGKSIAIRILTEKIDIAESFESQEKLVRKALEKVDILYNWIKNNLYKNGIE
ncbi:MAG: PD-(D/E)XK nuclease family protein [Bacteroidales bacterium]|nr:PD-(D/E)XK nuclease family protein [Bacteroidales bacterium]